MPSAHPDLRVDCDVVVAGAGPAGSAAAAHLARGGLRVVLVDPARFPRDKVCGDFVGPAAVRELQQLGVLRERQPRQGNAIRDAAVFIDGKAAIRAPLPRVVGMPELGRVIPRQELDAAVLRRARATGVELLEGFRVESFETTPRRVTVTAHAGGRRARVRARLLIGADGSASLVARALRGAPPPPEDRIVAIRAYFEGVCGPCDRADLHFGRDFFPGYCWLFPTRPHGANVGLGMLVDTLPPPPKELRALLERLIEGEPALRARLSRARRVGKIAGWPLTTYDPQLPVVGERCLLVGDAAGLINPLNGEGIQYALQSGRWAAEVVLARAAADAFSADSLAAYARRVERELRLDMAVCRLLVEAIRNRRLSAVFLESLRAIAERAQRDRRYATIAGGVLAGVVPARWAVTILGPTIEEIVRTGAPRAARTMVRHPSLAFAALARAARTGRELATRETPLRRWLSRVLEARQDLAEQVSALGVPG
ncbi:MAG TPA: geranylgeranyl reductase family protein [Myxococcota bacterium]|nr:geranylgeranyl reductase family protein [Myxococcota bacterium]